MRPTRLLLALLILTTLVLTSSAFAQSWSPWTIESYYTDTGTTNGAGQEIYQYDYVVWYENWDSTNNVWTQTSGPLNYVDVQWPDAWGTSGVASLVTGAGFYNDTGQVALVGSVPTGVTAGSGTTLNDNTYFNGAVNTVGWNGFTNIQSGTLTTNTNGWQWTISTNDTTSEADSSGTVDYAGPLTHEGLDAAVRNQYFYASDPFSGNTALQTAWGNYIDSTSGAINSTWDPLVYTGTTAQDNLTGYNRPIAWLWLDVAAPPTTYLGALVDGGTHEGNIYGPTPELPSTILLLLTFLPAGLILRRKRS